MMRRERTCGNQDGERRKKRERVWLSDSVNPGLGSLPLIPLFPLIKTAELPLISSPSLSLSPLSFHPFLLLLLFLLLILFFTLFSFFFYTLPRFTWTGQWEITSVPEGLLFFFLFFIAFTCLQPLPSFVPLFFPFLREHHQCDDPRAMTGHGGCC